MKLILTALCASFVILPSMAASDASKGVKSEVVMEDALADCGKCKKEEKEEVKKEEGTLADCGKCKKEEKEEVKKEEGTLADCGKCKKEEKEEEKKEEGTLA